MTARPLSVWATAQTDARTQRAGRYLPGSTAHPAKMLPAIAAHAITHYTRPGDLVLDPMCGIGTTLVEAIHTGRDAIGIEYEPRWAALAAANAVHAQHHTATGRAHVICGDARDLPALLTGGTALCERTANATVALVLTSPPYGPTVHGQVTTRPGHGVLKHDYTYAPARTGSANLAHAHLPDLLAGFTTILTECARLLRPGGHAVITARPWRRNGVLIDLPSAILTASRTAGLVPVERCVALLAGLRRTGLVPRASFFQLTTVRRARDNGTPLHVIAHEDVLVFERRNTAHTNITATPSQPTLRHAEDAHRPMPVAA
jgi:SAM-dependent methyltransferase